MPQPSVATTEEEADEELDELAAATEEAADEASGSVDDLGAQASTPTPEVEEELADPVPTGGDSFFSGTETVEDEVGPASEREEPSEEFPGAPEAVGEPGEHSFEQPINEGTARLSVVGIEDETKKTDLQDEFEEVFEAFQLGHYGNRVMHDYLLHGAEDVNPIWGLAGSAMMCTVLVVYMRPDGDEVVSGVKERINEFGGNT